MRLPADDLLAQVAIDGVEQVFIAPRDGVVEISLREASSTEEHTLEVWTRSTATAGWVNKIDVIRLKSKVAQDSIISIGSWLPIPICTWL